MVMSTGDLEFMRSSNEELMPDTCDILSVTRVSDGAGGMTETWGTATASVACRVDFVNSAIQLSGGGIQPYSRMVMILPYDTVITEANRVKWNGDTYSVTSPQSDSWQTLKKVDIHGI